MGTELKPRAAAVSLICLLATVLPAPGADTSRRDLTYTIAPVRSQGVFSAVDISVSFLLPAPTVNLSLPSEYAGAADLDARIHDLRVSGGAASLAATEDSSKKTISGTAGQRVTLSYRLDADPAMKLTHPQYFEPIIKPTFFFLIGASALAVPDLGAATYNVHLRWQSVGGADAYGDSFGIQKPASDAIIDGNRISNLLFFGGDYRFQRITGIGNPVTVATYGTWSFSDAAFAKMLERVLGIERRFWRDDPNPYFVVVLLPSDEQAGNFGGTGYTNAFALYLPRATALDGQIAYEIAHEYFHTWNPRRLMRLRAPQAAESWFHEGFTDYYAYDLLLRAGVLSPDSYFASLNRNIATFAASGAAGVTNDEYVKHPFESALYSIPYRRGALLAFRWNARIRALTHGRRSLDDAMRGLLVRHGELPEYSNADLARYFDRWTNNEAGTDIERFIDRGERLDPPADGFGTCAERVQVSVNRWVLGFDEAATTQAKNIVTGVQNGSAAFAAGLRNGQELIGESIYYNDVRQPIVLSVLANGRPRRIEYSARGDSVLTFAYRAREPAGAFRACYAALS
ncbi:MAG TPA: hypothetical protein VFW34_01875 [Candidatus Rubrimentiphilum sp.]|nr:hypothetical protein [Candidatus Rubrimentiphilum sp.]